MSPPDPAAAPTIALVGGGFSVIALIDEMAATLTNPEVHLRIVAQDFDRVGDLAAHGRSLLAGRPGWQVEPCRTLPEAVDGAEVVVLLLRVGGLEARREDEAMSRAYGLPGDEGLGPGGAANAMRTLPVVADLARDLVRLAPDATVLNLVAPLGLTTRVLLDQGLDTIGVCELPLATVGPLAASLGGQTDLAYAGFNHLGWFWPVDDHGDPRCDGVAILEPAVDAGLVDRAVLERFEGVPLKYYYWLHDPAAAERLGIGRDPHRTDALIDLRDRARVELARWPDRRSGAVGGRPTPWFRDALVPILAGLLHGEPWDGYANVRNGDLVPAFDPDVVVEVPARIGADGVVATPHTAPMPPTILEFSRQVERSELLLHAAWRDGDRSSLEQSFVQGPHQLEPPTARRIARATEDRAGTHAPAPPRPPAAASSGRVST